MYLGDRIEFGVTDEPFIKPKMKQTEDYITGRSALMATSSTLKQYDLDLGLTARACSRWAAWWNRRSGVRSTRSRPATMSMQEVIEADHRVNAMEVELDGDCSQLIVRRQLAAGDLAHDLRHHEDRHHPARIGDEAQKIARMAKNIHERGGAQAPPVVEVRHAAEAAISMLRRTLDCFARLTRTASRGDPRRRASTRNSARSCASSSLT